MKFTRIYSETEIRDAIEDIIISISGVCEFDEAVKKLEWAVEMFQQEAKKNELNTAETEKLAALEKMLSALSLTKKYSLRVKSVEISE